MEKTLVFLAAGLGSRYGGFKQLAKFGPGRHCILEYSLHDAHNAGFRRAVGIIRSEHEPEMREMLRPATRDFSIEFIHQNSPAFVRKYRPPCLREKPWGSAHALMIAADLLGNQPFTVINGDDLYGREGWQDMAKLMEEFPQNHGLISYELAKTLSPFGKVSRGICQSENGQLIGIQEYENLQKKEGEIVDSERNESFSANAPVSMNFWYFQPTIFPLLEKYWQQFCENEAKDSAEFGLPGVIRCLILEKRMPFLLRPTGAIWQGITYAYDRENLEQFLRSAIAKGHYPPLLWRNE